VNGGLEAKGVNKLALKALKGRILCFLEQLKLQDLLSNKQKRSTQFVKASLNHL
jgi:hypothetical protein